MTDNIDNEIKLASEESKREMVRVFHSAGRYMLSLKPMVNSMSPIDRKKYDNLVKKYIEAERVMRKNKLI